MTSSSMVALVAQLNERWRVVVAHDETQWIVQRFHENDWRARSHCRTRYALDRCVEAYVGDVDPAPRAILSALPGHIDWGPETGSSSVGVAKKPRREPQKEKRSSA
jgi:hypothetical protein